jgi:hypothetical protein
VTVALPGPEVDPPDPRAPSPSALPETDAVAFGAACCDRLGEPGITAMTTSTAAIRAAMAAAIHIAVFDPLGQNRWLRPGGALDSVPGWPGAGFPFASTPSEAASAAELPDEK